MGFPCGSAGKNPLVTQETWVRSLGWEDPPGKGKTTHSSVLAWRIPWTKELDTTEGLSLHFIHPFMGSPGSSAGKESTCNPGDLGWVPGSGRSPGGGIGYPLQYSWASLVAQMAKNLPAMWETQDTFPIPGLGRSPGGGHGNPFQYSCLENPKDREAWKATEHRVTKNQTWLKRLSIFITIILHIFLIKSFQFYKL